MQSSSQRVIPENKLCGQAWRSGAEGLQVAILAAALTTFSLVACHGGRSSSAPPPPVTPEWFFVDNFSGNVSGFSASSGTLAPIPGSSAMFPFALTNFAVEPNGTFLAAITVTLQGVATLQIANIASGGAISPAPRATTVIHPSGLAISSQGVLAVSDSTDSTIQLLMFQSNALFMGATVPTAAGAEDLAFSADGKTLYANNGSAISVFSVSNDTSLQLLETAILPLAAGQLSGSVVRIRLAAAGNKLAATTLDGWLYVGNVSAVDGTLSGITETQVAQGANLEEVSFDPAGQNVYTGDQDNGGIYGFSVTGGKLTPLPGSPFSTGTLPGGPTGLAINSAGDRMYIVRGAQSAIFTYARNTNTGEILPTGEVVGTGGFLGGRIVRTLAH
jgi:DNA-binding beta-propeller fold protein YncE